MKLKPIVALRKRPARPCRNHHNLECGSVVLILLVLIGIMAVYLTCNNLVLHTLHRELGLLEKKQLEKFSRPPSPAPRDKTPAKP